MRRVGRVSSAQTGRTQPPYRRSRAPRTEIQGRSVKSSELSHGRQPIQATIVIRVVSLRKFFHHQIDTTRRDNRISSTHESAPVCGSCCESRRRPLAGRCLGHVKTTAIAEKPSAQASGAGVRLGRTNFIRWRCGCTLARMERPAPTTEDATRYRRQVIHRKTQEAAPSSAAPGAKGSREMAFTIGSL